MPVGAALAAGAVASAGIGALASNSAAHTQAAAAQQSGQYQLQAAQMAAQLQLGMFNTIRGDLSPYRAAGTSALPAYYRLLGLPAPTAAPSAPAPSAPLTGGAGAGLVIPGVSSGIGQLSNPNLASAGGGLIIPGVNGPAAAAMPGVGSVNFTKLFQDRPDVMQEYNRLRASADPNSPTWQQHGLDSPEGFAQWWLSNKPASDTYAAPTWSQADLDQAFPQSSAGGATPGATTPGNPNGPSLTGEDGTGTGDIQAYLESLPGYQFAKQQGVRAVTNSLSAKGFGQGSGPLGKGLARFVTGLADSTYQAQLDRLSGAVGIGQNAATQTGTFGTNAATGAGGALVGGAGAYGSSITGAANAIAAGQVGSANAIGAGINGATNAYLTSKILGQYGG